MLGGEVSEDTEDTVSDNDVADEEIIVLDEESVSDNEMESVSDNNLYEVTIANATSTNTLRDIRVTSCKNRMKSFGRILDFLPNLCTQT